MTTLSHHVAGMRRFDNSDREDAIVGDLDVTKPTKFDGIPASTWFATYNPEECRLDLHFNGTRRGARQVLEFRLAADERTGATWVTLDGAHHTVHDPAISQFTIPMTGYYMVRTRYGSTERAYAHANIEPFEAWLNARGDDVSAQRLRENFPKIFTPPAPEPQPKPQPVEAARKGFFRRK